MGRDGKVRGAVLQVVGEGRRATSLYRPVEMLYPLEVSQPTRGDSDNNPEQPGAPLNQPGGGEDTRPDDPDASKPPSRRLRRATTLQARDRILAQALNKAD